MGLATSTNNSLGGAKHQRHRLQCSAALRLISQHAYYPRLTPWATDLPPLRGQASHYFVHSDAICDSTFTGTVTRYSSPAAHIARSTVWATPDASASSTSTTISS